MEKKINWVSVVSILGVGVIGYLLYKSFTKPVRVIVETEEDDDKADETTTTPTTSTDCKKYIVSTKSGGLNIRKNADIKSDEIGSLKRKSTILGKTTSNEDWIAVFDAKGSKCGTDSEIYGYVSTKFLSQSK
jgi:hypothetical protein